MLAVAAPGADADDIYVDVEEGSDETGDGSSENPYANITTAVENATAGDVVIVRPGTYKENMIEIYEPITVRSESGDPDDTIVGILGYSIFRIYSDNVTLDGFTIQYGSSYMVYLDTVDHCTISNNRITMGYVGILIDGNYLNGASNNTITGNNVTGNTYIGIQVGSDGGFNVITDNVVTDNGHGIQLYFTGFETVTNNIVSDNDDMGIFIHQCDDSLIQNNTVEGNVWRGIYMSWSTNNTLRDNTLNDNPYNTEFISNDILDYRHDIDTSNTVDGRPIYYWVGEVGGQVPSDAGMVGLVDCSGVEVLDLNLTNNGASVLVVNTNDTLIRNVSASYGRYGIRIYYSTNVTVTDCYTTRNGDNGYAGGIDAERSDHIFITDNICFDQVYGWSTGIRTRWCSNVTIEGNLADDNGGHGIALSYTLYTRVANNTATNNLWGTGIYMNDCDLIIVEDNNATDNGDYGFYFTGCQFLTVRNNVAYLNSGGSTTSGFYLGYIGPGTFHDNTGMFNGNGLYLYNSDYIDVFDNILTDNGASGLYLFASSGNNVSGNDLRRNTYGIDMSYESDRNSIVRNDCSGSTLAGIRLDYNNNENTIANNTICDSSGDGIALKDHNLQNVIAHNMICNNSGIGIHIESTLYNPGPSTNNTIYNNYLDNDDNVYDNFTNIWNISLIEAENIVGGSFIGGNYFSDYLGIDDDEDGIGDTEHEIPGGESVDWLPLYVYSVPEPPVADFSWEPASPSNGTEVHFSDLSDPGNAEIVNWTWDIPYAGHGITPAYRWTQNPVWYFNSGTYSIELNVTNAHGLSSEVTKNITVGEGVKPAANFSWSPANPMNGSIVTFLDRSILASGEIVNWTWDIPYAGYAITPGFRWSRSPTWRFNEGSYEITLTITDSLGNNDSVTKTLNVTESLTIIGPFSKGGPNGTVLVRAGVSGDVTIDITFLDGPPGSKPIPNGTYFDIINGGNGTIVWVNITFIFPITGARGDQSMYVWNDATGEWEPVGDDFITGGSGDDTIYGNVSHLTVFAVGDTIDTAEPSGDDDEAIFPAWLIILVIIIVVLFLVFMWNGRRHQRDDGSRPGGRWSDELPGEEDDGPGRSDAGPEGRSGGDSGSP